MLQIQENENSIRLAGFICDSCGRTFNDSDDMENFEHFFMGTMYVNDQPSEIILDICQDCAIRMLKKHILSK